MDTWLSVELRAALPEVMEQLSMAMNELLKNSHAKDVAPLGKMFTSGHGEHWRTVMEFVRRNGALRVEADRAAH